MKKISTILIILGIVVGSYPIGDRIFSWYWQRRIMENYQALTTAFDQVVEASSPSRLGGPAIEVARNENQEEKNGEDTGNEANIENQDAGQPQSENSINNPQKVQKETPIPIGILKIDRINLHQPIFEGANQKNLKIGLGHMEKTSKIGEIGNVAIAGHRSHTYGRFFNRLDELEVNDEIVIQTAGESFRYVVIQKLIVEPTDISVLKGNKEEKILTLITCHPLYTSTHRLIIHAKLD